MKLNKFKTYIPAAALLLTMGMSSCMADLDKGNIDPTVEPVANKLGLYSKCYAGLVMEGNDGSADFTIDDAGKSTLLRNIYNFNELSTDESICWWSDGGITDIGYNQCVPGNATLKFLYYRLMSDITYCNEYLADFGADDDALAAEVRFLRAYYYYLALDFFGDPSFVTTITTESPKQAHAYNDKFVEGQTYGRDELLAMGREYLFKWIESELKDVEGKMLEAKAKTDTDGDYGRADKASVWMLLSRLYLNAGTYLNNDGQNNDYWAQAKEYAEKVINSDYSLFTADKQSEQSKALGFKPYDMLFCGDNGSNGASCEAILPLLQDGKNTKGWGGSLFFIASHSNQYTTTAQGKDMGTTANNWSGMRVRPEFVQKFTSNPESFVGKTTKDIRDLGIDDRALVFGASDADGTRTLDLGDNDGFYNGLLIVKWQNNYSNGGTSHDSYDVDCDFFLFRVAEAYLTAAEASLHINGANDATALKYVNALRSRANAGTISTIDINYILDERARELYCEGLRRTDLIRYNQFGGSQATYSWSYKGGSKNGVTFEKYLNVYPIPTSEIQANSNLTQIYGYSTID